MYNHMVFYYGILGQPSHMLYSCNTENVTDICFMFENGFKHRTVYAIQLSNGEFWNRLSIGWEKL